MIESTHSAPPANSIIEDLQRSFLHHLQDTLVKDKYSASPVDLYNALAYSVRDLLIEGWLDTQQSYYRKDSKRVYYLSMEFLVGRFLQNNLMNLGLWEEWKAALAGMGIELEKILELEWDAGLGNGGLGRLAACFLDSMATLKLPAFGYGIRYEYGMFYQRIVDGGQSEMTDSWLRYTYPWEYVRQDHLHRIQFDGRTTEYVDEKGQQRFAWVDTRDVMALAYDIPISGYENETVNTLRLWSAKATREFELGFFNQGNYIGAVESKMKSENISKVLYPADHMAEGRELRLRQEYFLCAATLRDILNRFLKKHNNLKELPDKVAIQLNDTHPTLVIPELMRILLDEHRLGWDEAWSITRATVAYTNHTIMSEALEKWPVSMMASILPRHLQIIFKINFDFLNELAARYPGDHDRARRMSIIGEEGERTVRMAHLAIIGSHSINGVSALHSEILKNELFRDFFELWPERFSNKTNGITQRRWLRHSNNPLSDLISSKIGSDWVKNLDQLQRLRDFAKDKSFQKDWIEVKRANKEALAAHILKNNKVEVSPDSMFDCQTKRIHEYKRQLLAAIHAITRYQRIKANPKGVWAPRTIIFSGKAAPSYFSAKRIIRLISGIGEVINNDPEVQSLLKVVFLANYNVSLAELIFPASDLSEQISTAGTEASGTGNMKYALNGALTIGTLDGANIEIMEEVGRENIFIFGMNAQEVGNLKRSGYRPYEFYQQNSELRGALDMIRQGVFSRGDQDLFRPIVEDLLSQDHYCLLADYASYVAVQEEVDKLYLKPSAWAEKSILNVAGMGKFSSDRTINEYAKDIWNIKPEEVQHFNREEFKFRALKNIKDLS
ncbi:MAG: glycogen/starch/alpha-glucan phosphorylase [Bdellovibrionaceae bacterium]|nr:glycogen/starch/alpha-glucan phosphorylase [Pseudobdellovibrionaceae bacterium]